MRRLAALVSLLLLVAPTAATADWLSLRSNHFQVIGNESEGQLRTVALKLEQFREVVVRQLNPALLRDESAPPVVVIVFRDDKSYEPFMPLANGKVVRVAGLFQPGEDVNYITLPLQAGERAFPVIFHEYSHLLTRGVFADAPLWFNEGLAEYYSTFEVTSNGRRANIGKPIARHVQLLQSRRLPFARFFAIDRSSAEYTKDTADRDVLYAQAWAIVHHALHGESKRKDQLLAFVTKLAAGDSTENSFREAYGIELSDLEREVQRYVQNSTYHYGSFEFSDSIVTHIEPRATRISDAEADAWLGDLLVHMDRGEEATARLEKALVAKPDLALAHASLGALQVRQGRTAEGMAHLREAFRLGTANETAYFMYAYELVAQGPQDQEALTQASRSLERAIGLRPGYTEAKVLLGYTYLAAGNYAAARDLMTPLIRAEPTNYRAALQLAEALLQLNDSDGARNVLGPIVARAKDEADRGRARALLARAAGLQTRSDTLAAAGLPATDSTPRSVVRPAFRHVETGEQRVYGVFESVECGRDSVVLVVRTADARLRAHASSFSAVEFITYRTPTTTSVSCGPQTPPIEVYLTWRLSPGSNAATEGTAVAVEILPEGFLPSP
jgi:tetratricopeptide (TPR) repeat protein